MPAGGTHGRYLRVDLTTGDSSFVPLPDEVLRRYIGGVGLGAWLLLKEAPPGVDPLSPEAPLIFALSPLVGTPLTTSAKFAVVAKSPLTNRINDAISSSHFAIAAKRAGFDALVLVGACPGPSVLVIDGLLPDAGETTPDTDRGEPVVRLEDGAEFWGLPASEAERRLKKRLAGPDDGPVEIPYHTAAIGPAGEHLVRFATLSNVGRHAGRGGIGAVMGSKRLKALAVRGRRFVPLAEPETVNAMAKDLSARSFGPATEKYRELGTVANLLVFNRLAVLPTRNFRDNTFEAAESLSAEKLNAMREKTRSSCAACTIGCEHVYGRRPKHAAMKHAATRGAAAGDAATGDAAKGDADAGGRERGVRLEYESLFALGPLCGVGDQDAVLESAALCDDLGLDTISAGGTIAFAMECAERGLLDVDLKFGDGAAVHDILGKIARREGLGDLLAEGSRRAAETIGGEAPGFAPHVKGLEIPGYEPRALQAMALGFAVGTRGADHNRSSAYEIDFSEGADRMAGNAGSAHRAVETEDRSALMDSLILCKFLRGVFGDLFDEAAAMLRAITGWNVTPEELHETTRRIVATRKWFNEREGWTPAEDILPDRFLTEKLRDGVSAGATLPRERLTGMITEYNRARGFTPEGRVPESMRRDLDIEG